MKIRAMKTVVDTIWIVAVVVSLFFTADRLIFLNHDTVKLIFIEHDNNIVNERDVEESAIRAVVNDAVKRGKSPCEIAYKSDNAIIRCGGYLWPFYEEYKVRGQL